MQRLLGQGRKQGRIDEGFGAQASTVVRAQPSAASARRDVDPRCLSAQESMEKQSLVKRRGGLSTKIHLIVEGTGYPLGVVVTPGQQGDALRPFPGWRRFISQAALGSATQALSESLSTNATEINSES